MNQIEIRIRHEDESTAIHLCTWNPTELDSLIPTIEAWGLAYDYSNNQLPMSGQFVVADGEAFFEVTVHAPDDDGAAAGPS